MELDDFLVSRESLFGALPTRQASALLFAIESRTAHLKQQSRLAAARYQVEDRSEHAEGTFLEALSQGREQTALVSIQDIERYAPHWESLIPQDNSKMRVALAQIIGNKYDLTYQNVPLLRAVLQLDEVAVKETYESYYKQPLENIYVQQISRIERLRWRWERFAHRLDRLPPFWTAYSLTITETVGATILALPIALAKVGVLGGLVLLIILGLVNLLTLVALIETITRNGNMRYGHTYFGSLVGDYLGNFGTRVLTISLLSLIAMVLIAYYIGISSTLEEATGISSPIWVALTFATGLYFLKSDNLNSTVASAMVISAINIGIILLLIVLALPHLNFEFLQYSNIPLFDGQALDPSMIELIFGVLFAAFFGHISAGNAAKVVLREDATGNALLWGNIAAMLTTIGLYCLWVIAIGGSVAPDVLVSTSGTAISPLADIIGPVAHVLGSIFVVLGMGMASVHFSLALFNQMREWLPEPDPESNSLLKRENARFWVSVLPIGVIFLVVEWMIWSEQGSFSSIISFIGVTAVPMLAGIFPVLMLTASRRKGEYVPGSVFQWLGNPFVLAVIYFIFWISVVVHGLIIWEGTVLRLMALLVSVVMLALTADVIRRRAYAKRTTLQIYVEHHANDKMFFHNTVNGKLQAMEMHSNYPEGQETLHAATGEIVRPSQLKSVVFQVPALSTPELKIWVHQITEEDYSVDLPVSVSVKTGDAPERIVDETIIPIEVNTPCLVEISF